MNYTLYRNCYVFSISVDSDLTFKYFNNKILLIIIDTIFNNY